MPKKSHSVDINEENGSSGDEAANLQVATPNMSENARAKRLRDAVETSGGRNKIAALAGIHPQSLTRYLNGRDIQSETLAAIADACGVSIEWLATGRGAREAAWSDEQTTSQEPQKSKNKDSYYSVATKTSNDHHYAVAESEIETAFLPLTHRNNTNNALLRGYDQVVEYYAFDKRYIAEKLRRTPENLVLIEARGNNMKPTICDGDILTIDTTPAATMENDQIYVIDVASSLVLKRVQQRLEALVLHDDNPRYPPETIPHAEAHTLNVIGQVILVTAPPR